MSQLSTPAPGDETMDGYSLHARKDQANLYAAPDRFTRPKRQAGLPVYSHEHAKPQQEETDPDITGEAVPHLRLEPG
jgi:hypothetical protein